VIDDCAAKEGVTLKQNYDAETLPRGMSLGAFTGGFTLLPPYFYVRNALIPSVVARPLRCELPTWTQDCWHRNCDSAPTDGSAREAGGDCLQHVVRGDSWSTSAEYLGRAPFPYSNQTIGVHVAKTSGL
jgi:LysR family hca operon transcriptional activator